MNEKMKDSFASFCVLILYGVIGMRFYPLTHLFHSFLLTLYFPTLPFLSISHGRRLGADSLWKME